MPIPLKILVVEDSEDDVLIVMDTLRRAGFEPSWEQVETEPAFRAGLQQQPDIILSDFSMPQFSGLQAADLNRACGRDIPFILISGTVGEEMAVEAMKRGVTDYFLKDRLARLGVAVAQALEGKKIREQQTLAEASLKLFRALVDRSSDGIEVIDPETGRLLDVNQTTCDRLGYTRAELLELRVVDIEAEAVEANTWRQMVDDIRRNGFKIVEGRHRRKDGTTYPIEVNVRCVTMDREYLIASVRDITERKRGEEEAARLAAIVQSSDDAIIGKTLTGIVTSWNAGAEKLFGYPADEMVGQSIRRLIPPELQHEEDAILTKLWRGESIRHYDTVRRRKDGSSLEVSVTISPVKDAGGRIIGFSKIASDNSARKQAELAVRASQERLDRTLEAARIGYWDLNLVTHQANRSLQHARIFGYTELLPEWSYDKFLEHVHADDREEVRGLFLAGVTVNTEWNFECRIIRCDGAMRWIWVHGNVVLDAAGAPAEMEGMVSDITDRRHVEEALRASERLLQTMMDLVPHFIFAKDSQSRHLFVNQACAAANGLTREQMIGRNDLEFLSDRAQAEGFMRNDREVIASGKPQIIAEEQLTSTTGETRIYQTTKIPFQLPDFDGPALLGVAVDITDVKRAEAALRENRAKLEAALASMTDAVFISDSHGQLIELNDAFATFHRFKDKAECYRTVAKYDDLFELYLADGSLVPMDMWPVSRVIRGESVTNAEYRLRRKDTGETWAGSYSFSPIRDKDGGIAGSVLVARDVTERKQAEAEIRNQLRELERWHEAMLNREGRVLELKREVNELLGRQNQPPRYTANP